MPLGGSNALGTWGYLDAVDELADQLQGGLRQGGAAVEELPPAFSDIAVATGSGGTTGGLALGVHLSGLDSRMHGFSVSDHPEYFYDYIDRHVLGPMYAEGHGAAPPLSRNLVRISAAHGRGYAKSTREELELIRQVALTTGVVLDPVYSGKAVAAMFNTMWESPNVFQGRDILFWHTGGIFGVFDKADEIRPLLDPKEVQPVPLG